MFPLRTVHNFLTRFKSLKYFLRWWKRWYPAVLWAVLPSECQWPWTYLIPPDSVRWNTEWKRTGSLHSTNAPSISCREANTYFKVHSLTRTTTHAKTLLRPHMSITLTLCILSDMNSSVHPKTTSWCSFPFCKHFRFIWTKLLNVLNHFLVY